MRYLCSLLLVIFLCGCATMTGPAVSNEEINQAQEELKAKALKFQVDYLVRVNNVGYRLLKHLPEESRKGHFVSSGLLLAQSDKYFKKIYNLQEERGIVVLGIIEDSPAKEAGLQAGDLIQKVDGINVDELSDIAYIFNHKGPGNAVGLAVSRGGNPPASFNFRLADKPVDVSFRMVDEQEVNAGATSDVVVVTYGLMRFIKNDNEAAVILGHELAHVVRNHHVKASGVNLISALLSIAAGIGANYVVPGAGDVLVQSLTQALSANYSQDLEREADYFGLKYVYLAGYNIEAGIDVWERFAVEIPQSMTRNYFSTHPSSPERMVRVKKIIQELRGAGTPIPQAK